MEFHVSFRVKMFKCKELTWFCFRYGLILEGKSIEQDYERDVPMPKLIAIHHPLDDIGRVVTKRKPAMGLSEWRNDRNQIVMVAEDPSLCVTFDHQLVRSF